MRAVGSAGSGSEWTDSRSRSRDADRAVSQATGGGVSRSGTATGHLWIHYDVAGDGLVCPVVHIQNGRLGASGRFDFTNKETRH